MHKVVMGQNDIMIQIDMKDSFWNILKTVAVGLVVAAVAILAIALTAGIIGVVAAPIMTALAALGIGGGVSVTLGTGAVILASSAGIWSAVTYYKLEHLVPQLYESGRVPFVVLLDGLTDVRNFGAIARTCDCAGVDAIVIPERNSVSAGADAVKTSAGALHYLPVCREHSLAWAVRFLKDSGYKVYGASEKAQQSYIAPDYTAPVAIVMGSEEKGISDEILRLCDGLVAIPEYGHINSLNVSVATGIIVYEVVRQRNLNGDKDI